MPSIYSINSISQVYYAYDKERERRTGVADTRLGLERLTSAVYTSLKCINEFVCGASTKPSIICIDLVA